MAVLRLCVLYLAVEFSAGATLKGFSNANHTARLRDIAFAKADCPADGSKDCTKAACCATAGDKCYQKNNWWASCKPMCVKGIDPADPPKYQQPWTCKVLGEGPPAGDCPKDGSENCLAAKCCATPGDKCYMKNSYWASCKPTCTPGIDPADPPKYQQPWDCKVLGEGPPAGDCPEDGSENCLAAKCCKDPNMKCYMKNNYWASCKESCSPGIDPNDPPKYQQPWSCKVVGAGVGGGGGEAPAPAPRPEPEPEPEPHPEEQEEEEHPPPPPPMRRRRTKSIRRRRTKIIRSKSLRRRRSKKSFRRRRRSKKSKSRRRRRSKRSFRRRRTRLARRRRTRSSLQQIIDQQGPESKDKGASSKTV